MGNMNRAPSITNTSAIAADKLEEADNVIQFFQATLTRAQELELTQAEKEGLFTLFEWQRSHLKEVAGLVRGRLVIERD